MSVFGNYQLERLLGRGGMAEVFLARPLTGPHTGKPMALKRLNPQKATDPTYTDLFLGEADLSRYLVHPNIVQVYDAGSVEDTFYIAMEYIAGCDLSQVLAVSQKRRLHLPVDTACYIAHMVANALHFAHTARSGNGKLMGIVHCDVTPSNVFISREGDVKLGDFGVASTRAMGAAIEGGLAGKPQYFAPELLLGEPPTGSTDVFALGVIFYEMLCAKKPFDGADYAEICDRIVAGKYKAPSVRRQGLTPEIDAVVQRSLRRRNAPSTVLNAWMAKVRGPQTGRYDTAESFGTDLALNYNQRRGNALALAGTLQALFDTRSPAKTR